MSRYFIGHEFNPNPEIKRKHTIILKVEIKFKDSELESFNNLNPVIQPSPY